VHLKQAEQKAVSRRQQIPANSKPRLCDEVLYARTPRGALGSPVESRKQVERAKHGQNTQAWTINVLTSVTET